jgi:hypothetical protein
MQSLDVAHVYCWGSKGSGAKVNDCSPSMWLEHRGHLEAVLHLRPLVPLQSYIYNHLCLLIQSLHSEEQAG